MTSSLEDCAVQALLRANVLGFALARADQVLYAKQGSLAQGVALEKKISVSITALRGLENDICALKTKDNSKLTLPCLRIINSQNNSEKINIDIIWDNNADRYVVLLSLSDARLLTSEQRLREKRVKRIAEEAIKFNAGQLLKADVVTNLDYGEASQATANIALQKTSSGFHNPLNKLTPRERDVVKLMVQGKPNKVIAHDLKISEKTVEATRARAKKRLGIRTSTELISIAMQQRLNEGFGSSEQNKV